MKRYLSVIVALALLTAVAAAGTAGAAGTQSDPAVTLSYINGKFIPSVLSGTDSRISGRLEPVLSAALSKLAEIFNSRIDSVDSGAMANAVYGEVADRVAQGYAKNVFADRFRQVTLEKGDTLTGAAGTGIQLVAGSARVAGAAGKMVINITLGKDVSAGTALSAGSYYMIADDDGTGAVAASDSVTLAVDGIYRILKAYKAAYTDLADALNIMGLFRGTNNGYELTRGATRLEALIMLVRLVGEEEKALAYKTDHPFGDVPKWAGDEADKYVAYAYDMGYTKGTSADRFSPNVIVTPEQYVTFLLRALGYSDNSGGTGDFVWSNSVEKAEEVGLLTASEGRMIKRTFLRDQVVYTSFYALSTKLKGSSRTLLSQLIREGAVDEDLSEAALDSVTRARPDY